MKQIAKSLRIDILLLAIIALVTSATMTSCATADAASSDYVYICTGPQAKVYHKTDKCKGLKKCSGSIKKVRRSETDRRPCKICY